MRRPIVSASSVPTAAQLRKAIDSGETGDKIAADDPAAAPLGTGDEAAGNPPSKAELRTAVRQEVRQPRSEGEWAPQPTAVLFYLALVIAIGIILIGGELIVMSG
jgi:hypothetical protein